MRDTDAVTAARSEASRLRSQNADVVIGLKHLSLAEDQRLAASASVRCSSRSPPPFHLTPASSPRLMAPISQYDVIRVLPFGGRVMAVKITGALLAKVLDQGLANRGSGGFLQTARVTRDAGGVWMIGGQPLEPDRSYQVAINDFLLTGKESGLASLTPSHSSLEPLGDRGDIRQRLIQHWKASP